MRRKICERHFKVLVEREREREREREKRERNGKQLWSVRLCDIEGGIKREKSRKYESGEETSLRGKKAIAIDHFNS